MSRLKINPVNGHIIVRVVEPKKKHGIIEIPQDAVAKSTLGEVMIPTSESYHRNGELKDSEIKQGMFVRFPTGGIGTEMPEAPEGEKWLCLPEDCIYYTTQKLENDDE